jgi:hypothetical protein
MTIIVRGVRTVMSVAILAGALAGSWAHTPDVRAAVASRAGPLIWIAGTSGASAGSCQINVGVVVSASSTQIQTITYAVHGPVGTAVTKYVATGGALQGKESYTYTADRTDLSVSTITTVTTTGGSVPVTVHESGNAWVGSTHVDVSGMSNQPILTVIGSDSTAKPNVNWGS